MALNGEISGGFHAFSDGPASVYRSACSRTRLGSAGRAAAEFNKHRRSENSGRWTGLLPRAVIKANDAGLFARLVAE